MLALGIESSCDESGVALYDTAAGLLGHTLYSQVALHAEYGGVVPELASRDHIRRLLPLTRELLARCGCRPTDLGGIAYTEGPGLAGALLVGASIATSLAYALSVPVVGIHHLEGHLLSPLLDRPRPDFPYVALLVSGGHTQLMRVDGVGQYYLLGETLDDAAGEAFDKTAKLLGLPYPGGPALARLAESGNRSRFKLPRPMAGSGDLNFSFSGLKTAAQLLARRDLRDDTDRADIAAAFEEAVIDILAVKALAAVKITGIRSLVIAGGVGSNRRLRHRLHQAAAEDGFALFHPRVEFCTDNGAMIAFAGALRLAETQPRVSGFTVRPRWDLDSLQAPLSPRA